MNTVSDILRNAGFVPVVPVVSRRTGTPETALQSHVPVVPAVPVEKSESENRNQKLRTRLRRLAGAEGLPDELVDSLGEPDLDGCAGLDDATIVAYLRAVRDSALREAGRVPADETAKATCARCGPIWTAPEVAAVAPVVDGWPRVLGCPWCHLRDRASIPRPPVRCGECKHFIRDTVNPDGGMGRCAVDRATLPNDPLYYPHASRQCERFSPS